MLKRYVKDGRRGGGRGEKGKNEELSESILKGYITKGGLRCTEIKQKINPLGP